MENVPGAVYRCEVDADWTMVGIGDDIERITGFPAADFIASARRSFSSIIHPEDLERVHRECREAIAADRPFALEYRAGTRRGRLALDPGPGRQDARPPRPRVARRDHLRHHRAACRRAGAARARRRGRAHRRAAGLARADLRGRRRRPPPARARSPRRRPAAPARRARSGSASPNASCPRAMPPRCSAQARAELDAGLAELRELARGIHPAVLTDHGLSAAVRALAMRCAIPVEMRRRALRPARAGDRDRALLHGRRGADQRRPVRGRLRRHGPPLPGRRLGRGRGRGRRLRRRRPAAGLRPARARRTGSARSRAPWRSRARPAAARGSARACSCRRKADRSDGPRRVP